MNELTPSQALSRASIRKSQERAAAERREEDGRLIRKVAAELDIRGLIDEVCRSWNVETPIGFATDLQNKIVDNMVETASEK